MNALTASGPSLVGTAIANLRDDPFTHPHLQSDGAGGGSPAALIDDDRCGNGPRPPFPHRLALDSSVIHPSLLDRVVGREVR